MLRGNANIECTTTDGDDDSNDDNVSLECADSGLGLQSDPDSDRVVAPPVTLSTFCPASTACRQPPADMRQRLAVDNQPVH